MELPRFVLSALAETFPPESQEIARERLPSEADLHISEEPEWSQLYERVLLAIVGLSEGDLSKLDHEISAASRDWRDVLLAYEGWH